MVKKPEDLIIGYRDVSSVSFVFDRINEAIGSPKSSVGYISRLISEDAGLTARLLKMVNSAYFGFPSKIDTISRAVMVVGSQQLRDLALATSVMKTFKGIPEHFVTMESFWRHSISCGVAARILASLRREPNVERFFVGGILHDIGRLVLFTQLPAVMERVLERSRTSELLLHDTEHRIMGFDHTHVGRALVHAWRLPPSLEEMVAYHHRPDLARRYPVEAAVIHVADILAHTLNQGTSGETFVPPLSSTAWARLDVSKLDLTRILDLVTHQYNDVVETMTRETA